MSPKKKPEPEPKPRHETTSESMVAFRCRCGYPWQNERLRGKTDGELIIERDSAFLHHCREMEANGF